MLDSQHAELDAGMYDGDPVREFANWIERVTQPRPNADYHPRHRSEGDAG